MVIHVWSWESKRAVPGVKFVRVGAVDHLRTAMWSVLRVNVVARQMDSSSVVTSAMAVLCLANRSRAMQVWGALTGFVLTAQWMNALASTPSNALVTGFKPAGNLMQTLPWSGAWSKIVQMARHAVLAFVQLTALTNVKMV